MREHGNARLGPEKLLVALRRRNGNLGKVFSVRLNAHGAVAEHERAGIAELAVRHFHHEEGAHKLAARSGFNNAQSRMQHIFGCMASAANQTVCMARLQQHGAEIHDIVHLGIGLFGSNALALAQLIERLGHFLTKFAFDIVDNGRAIELEALRGDFLRFADDHDVRKALLQRLFGGFQDTFVVALGQNDGLLIGLSAVDHSAQKRCHAASFLLNLHAPNNNAEPRFRDLSTFNLVIS